MGKLTREDVLKLARLARLQVSDEEVEELAEELSSVLQYVEQLQAVDIAGFEPTNQVSGLTNVFREDVTIDYGYEPLSLLANAPKTQANQLKVDRMIG